MGMLLESMSLLLLIVTRMQDCLCRNRIRDMGSLVLLWLSCEYVGKPLAMTAELRCCLQLINWTGRYVVEWCKL